jgi:hypothetical protein
LWELELGPSIGKGGPDPARPCAAQGPTSSLQSGRGAPPSPPLSLGRTASSSCGGSLVLPPCPGWRIWPDGAGMPDPSRKRPRQPTRHLSRPRPATCSSWADVVGSVACPWRPGGMPRCPPSPGSKGRAARPARHQETGMGSSSGTGWSWAAAWPAAATPSSQGTCDSSRQPGPSRPPIGHGSRVSVVSRLPPDVEVLLKGELGLGA